MDAGAALRASAISVAFSGRKYRWKGAAAGYGAGFACACICRVAPGTTTSARSATATRLTSFFGMELSHFDFKRLAPMVKLRHRVHGDRTRETRRAGYEYACTSPSPTTAASASPPSCPTERG